MSSSTIRAARACAFTLLFHSLRLQAFRGAVPHVLVVVDRLPCVQQKVVVEGYMRVLRAYQQQGAAYLTSTHDSVTGASATAAAAAAGDDDDHDHPAWCSGSRGDDLFLSLLPGTETPSGSAGWRGAPPSHSDDPAPLSYSLMAFRGPDFLGDVTRLQRLLRHCGDGQSAGATAVSAQARCDGDGAADPHAAPRPPPSSTLWSAEHFKEEFDALGSVLGPLLSSSGAAADDGDSAAAAAAAGEPPRWQALFTGPPRELLGCVLVQEHAFQNELRRYRLRLGLFDLGIRVAEHCHLSIMSKDADRLAREGRYAEALADDQVYSYARSCAFRPGQAQCLARAIADSIDLHSWRRNGVGAAPATPTRLAPPASVAAALHNAELQSIFNEGALDCGAAATDGGEAAAAAATTDIEAALKQPIDGPGVPLSIICRDPAKVLTYSGGMESCLTNTGYYAAAHAPERNDVVRHRERFQTAHREASGSGGDGGSEGDEAEVATTAAAAAAAAAPVRGRLKKKDFLAQRRANRAKPSKAGPGGAAAAAAAADDDEDDCAVPRGATAGSCIANSIGGTFPIGEVISESFDLSQLSGSCDVLAYPDAFKEVTMSRPAPFSMTVERGVVTHISDDAPAEFLDLVSLVRQVEGKCYVRELGIGLNPYVGPAHVVSDVTTFERQWGIHISLGQRHPLFVKQRERRNPDGTVAAGVSVEGPVLKRKAGKYHIDVFLDAAQLRMGDVFSIDFTKGIAVP